MILTRNRYEVERARLLLQAWQNKFPARLIGPWKIADLEALVLRSEGNHQRVFELRSLEASALVNRDDDDQELWEAVIAILDTAKGDPEIGRDSDFVKASGLKRRSEYRHPRPEIPSASPSPMPAPLLSGIAP